LRNRVFAVLWVATVVGNVGTWMRDTTSAWLMAELTPSPTLVAMVQAAGLLPVFLLSLPAGTLADIVDRRRLLIAVQTGLLVVSLLLALAALSGAMTPPLLLALTLAAGVGAALMNPVWQAVVPELVGKPDLRPAIALNGLGINVARAIGPAAGFLIAAAGAAAAYLADVVTYLVAIAALGWWRREVTAVARPERFTGALQAGLRHAAASPPLRRVLLRTALFFLVASAFWALLPLVARDRLGTGPAGYGLLLGALGAGAILGAVLLPRLGWTAERLVAAGTLTVAAATAALAAAPELWSGVAILLVTGTAWIAVLTSLNATAQGVLPNWVRGRGLALYLTAFYGALTLGSVIWGQVAEFTSVSVALIAAGAGGALVALAATRLPLPAADADLTPSHHWPAPSIAGSGPETDRTALITVTYRIDPADRETFAARIERLGETRRRNGAVRWGVFADVGDPERIVEWFITPSWTEHLRQHDRVSAADKAIQDEVNAFHRGGAPPAVAHLVSITG
jgi:MFS family permease